MGNSAGEEIVWRKDRISQAEKLNGHLMRLVVASEKSEEQRVLPQEITLFRIEIWPGQLLLDRIGSDGHGVRKLTEGLLDLGLVAHRIIKQIGPDLTDEQRWVGDQGFLR